MGKLKRLGAASLVALLASASDAATLKLVTFEPVDDKVRVVIAFDDRFDAPSAFAMDGPQRLVIDLPGNKADTRSYEGQGLASKARTAQFSADKARVVIDLSAPAVLGDATAADNKLSLILRPSDATAFAKSVAKGRSQLPGIASLVPVAVARAEPPKQETSRIEPKPAPVVAAAKPPVPEKPPVEKLAAKPEPKPQQVALAPKAPVVRPVVRAGFRPLVVIDAGHGGHDVGALSVYEQRREKDVTLAIARAIRRELEGSGKFRVLMTRADDRFLPLPQRVAIAQRAKADLFISVHADSAPVPEARGASVYTLSEVASDREAARLAAKENKSDILAGFNVPLDNVDVADILIDLAQRETMNVSASFAATLQREMSPKVHFKTHGHRFAGFRVLKAPDVPSVLLETGYLSNEQDSRFLFSDSGQRAIAEGVRKAIEAHFMRRIAQR